MGYGIDTSFEGLGDLCVQGTCTYKYLNQGFQSSRGAQDRPAATRRGGLSHVAAAHMRVYANAANPLQPAPDS
jgi:hypothetical protein